MIIMIFPGVALSQEESLPDIILSIAEELAINDADSEAAAIFIEQLNALTEDPVLINSGDESDLSRLFFLNDFQIKSIIDYTTSKGKIVSAYEIALIPGFDRRTAEMMIPFIIFNGKPAPEKEDFSFNNSLMLNAITGSHEAGTSDLGSPWKMLARYKVTNGNIAGGFTVEKDAGEKFLYGTPPLPDFLSGYISYSSGRILKKLIIGDFAARFGNGINLNTSIRTGYLINSASYMTVRNEFRPYTSSDENNFLRGMAAELKMKKLDISLFFSQHKADATVKMQGDSSGQYIESLYKSGLHNTPSLLEKKDTVDEMLAGINFTYNFRSLKIGTLWSLNRFSIPFLTDIKEPENIYRFSSNANNVFSFYYNLMSGKFLFFGELSGNSLHKIAALQGVTIRPSDRLTINLIYRNYSPGFISFHGSAPGRNSSVNNEKGLTGNFTLEAASHLFISAVCDLSFFPWLKYRCDFPSKSVRQELRVNYVPLDDLNFDISFVSSRYENNSTSRPGIPGIEKTLTRSFKIQARYSPQNNVTLTSRVDFKIVTPSSAKGTLLLQDISYRFQRIPLTIWFRYCFFKCDDWDSRLYTYENDLLYSYCIPALSGEGTRSYILAKMEIGDLAEIRFKYGLTSEFTENYLISDKNEFRMQFRIWF